MRRLGLGSGLGAKVSLVMVSFVNNNPCHNQSMVRLFQNSAPGATKSPSLANRKNVLIGFFLEVDVDV